MKTLGKAGVVSALGLAVSAVMGGSGHGNNPVGEAGKVAQAGLAMHGLMKWTCVRGLNASEARSWPRFKGCGPGGHA